MSINPRAGRLLAGAVVLVVVGGGLALWLTRQPDDEWTSYGNTDQGWQVSVPPEWHTQAFTADQCAYQGYREAVWVTSASFTFIGPTPGEPEECFGRFVRAGFPGDGVALLVQPFGDRIGIFQRDCEHPPVRLPDLTSGMVRGGTTKVRYADVCAEGSDGGPAYQLRAWIGRDASSTDRELLNRVLSSFQFLRRPAG